MKTKINTIIAIFLLIGIQNKTLSQCHYSEKQVFLDSSSLNSLPFTLIFEDNFDSLSLDETKWEIYIGATNSYNMQKQAFTLHKEYSQRENVELENGYLKLITRKERKDSMEFIANWSPYTLLKTNFEYTSSAIASKEKFPINGKFEARIQLPEAYGLWPAFWLYGEEKGEYNEIDIFEVYTSSKSLNTNYYYASEGGYNKAYNCMSRDMKRIEKQTKLNFDSLTKGFHTYTLIWDEDKIQWYIDGKLFRTVAKYVQSYLLGFYNKETYYPHLQMGNKYRQNQAFPQGNMQIMLNTAVLLPPESPILTKELNSAMLIDYIKVFKRTPK